MNAINSTPREATAAPGGAEAAHNGMRQAKTPSFQLGSLMAGCTSLALAWMAGTPGALAKSTDDLVYVGTYTGSKSKGIYAFRFNAKDGRAETPFLAAETAHPTFLALAPNKRFLYAVGELGTFQGKKAGSVSAFSIDRATGRLDLLNQVSSGGPGPCHLVLDATGKWVLVANYGGGSVALLPIQGNGALGEAVSFHQHQGSSLNPQRQEGPHAHGVTLDAANRVAIVPDLGLDRLMIYRLDAVNGRLTPNDPPHAAVKPGSGPRHLAFAPDYKHAYGINELSSTITVYAYDSAGGSLAEVQTLSTLPDGFDGDNSTAEIEVHPTGKFVYGSNRGHDSIAVFARDLQRGTLERVANVPTQGKAPRNFAIDPTGAWLWAANQGSDNLVLFRIDPERGLLQPAGVTVDIGSPVCVQYVPLD
ncbi:MAG TPA: lactonase family protein [Verrucomicrobiota bacterium]|jgi:6-phosphogluconolactonase|nr:lactonase family protein [Verrucomicrobiota bacterium]OQC67757.1 MAG: 6-phosphogluconolactonase [Verrucomicrobia bacterium ADurb.Bin006]HOA60964.1 lactonase family protein [Verrucomicrobiota bacterium]HOF48594.1 lactonase family protein [Verrucomicrobiota bacterium]HOG86929.1 lactonase family protein [Verrucomicrobiota bacterium]